LLPDAAGPHSAGSPSVALAETEPDDDLADLVPRAMGRRPATGQPATGRPDDERNWAVEPGGPPRPAQAAPSAAGPAAAAAPDDETAVPAAGRQKKRVAGVLRPARQLPLLAGRNAAVLARSVPARVVFAGLPAALLVAFAVLIGCGALDGHAAASAWLVAGGFGLGLGYGLPQVRDELGVLRAERFAGLSSTAYVLAKATIVLPLLAIADAIVLLVPAACSRLPAGYGPVYLTVLLSSAVAYFLALLISVSLKAPARAPTSAGAASVPLMLLVAALLVVLDRAAWENWVLLGAMVAMLVMAASIVVDRRNPCPRRVT
jgi:hypothetical protein